jgi:hypothetical protein
MLPKANIKTPFQLQLICLLKIENFACFTLVKSQEKGQKETMINICQRKNEDNKRERQNEKHFAPSSITQSSKKRLPLEEGFILSVICRNQTCQTSRASLICNFLDVFLIKSL